MSCALQKGGLMHLQKVSIHVSLGNPSQNFSLSLNHLHVNVPLKPFPKQQILDSSILKEFADDKFKWDENCRMLSKQVENTEGKGEIAHHEQFLLFPQCFQKICTTDT